MRLFRAIIGFIFPPSRQISFEQPSPALKHWPASGSCTTNVVGESHYFENIRLVAMNTDGAGAVVHCTAVLVLENENPHDSNAVGVWIEGRQVGHLSKEDAPRFREALAAVGVGPALTTCDALIHGGGTYDGRTYSYSVELDLPLDPVADLSATGRTYPRPIRSSPHPHIVEQGPDQHLIVIPCVDRYTVAKCSIGDEVHPWVKPNSGDIYLFASRSHAGRGRLAVFPTQRYPNFASVLKRLEYLTIHEVDGCKVTVRMSKLPDG